MFLFVLIIGLGLSVFCVMLYNLTIFALPFAIGLQAALWAIDAGAGAIGTLAVGIVTGSLALVIGQVVFSTSRSLLIRWLLILLFAGPAAVAGYSLAMEVSELGLIPSPVWQQIFAVISAVVIGSTAMVRLAAFPLPPADLRREAQIRSRPRPTGLQTSMLE